MVTSFHLPFKRRERTQKINFFDNHPFVLDIRTYVWIYLFDFFWADTFFGETLFSRTTLFSGDNIFFREDPFFGEDTGFEEGTFFR